jgi:glutamate 5-kinase
MQRPASSPALSDDGRPIIVIKVGTSSLVDTSTRRVQVSSIARVAEAASLLASSGLRPIIVSSGAVGLGCVRLGLAERPTSIAGKQAAAAVGQLKLMSLYDDFFGVLGLTVAQVLLTHDNFGDRTQHRNARNAFLELLRLGVIPIVNENDTVATAELRVGDNDTLSALVAAMVGAQWLLLLTDVDALYEANPREVAGAAPIRSVAARDIYGLRRQMATGAARLAPGAPPPPPPPAPPAPPPSPGRGSGGGGGGIGVGGGMAPPTPPGGGAGTAFGTGGMATKLKAAQLATAAGTTVVVFNTLHVERLGGALCGGGGGGCGDDTTAFEAIGLGTTFHAVPAPVTGGKKRWVLSLAPSGSLLLDAGAAAAVEAHKSLFPAGIVGVEGEWEAQDAVSLVAAASGKEVARALVNYSAADCRKLQGSHSSERAEVLGYEGPEAVADRGHIVVI